MSPAQVLFARKFGEAVLVQPEGLRLCPWVLTKDACKTALKGRHRVRGSELDEHMRELTELSLGDVVQIQNQAGPHARKWDLSRVEVEMLGFVSYNVRVDDSGRVTKRNR